MVKVTMTAVMACPNCGADPEPKQVTKVMGSQKCEACGKTTGVGAWLMPVTITETERK